LLAKTLSSLLLYFIQIIPVSPLDFFTDSLVNGAAGIAVLFLLNWFLIKKWRK